jgi:hypothetical protein
MILAWSPSFSN